MKVPKRPRAPVRFTPRTPGGKVGMGMVISRSALGNTIRTFRIRLGMGQRTLAGMMGCAQATIGAIERGKTARPSDSDLRKLALILQINPKRLRRLMPPPIPLLPPQTPVARLIRTRREALGLTRMELVARLGSSDRYLGTLEQTTREIRYDLAIRLSRALELDLRRLLKHVAPAAAAPGSPLGQAIQERRRALGMSAEHLARLMGVSKTAVLAVEAGRTRLTHPSSGRMIQRYARVLEIPAAALDVLRQSPLPRDAPPARTFGGRLLRLRRERRWSQEELGRRARLSPTAVCLLESNTTRPHESTICRLASALDADVAVLLALRPKRSS